MELPKSLDATKIDTCIAANTADVTTSFNVVALYKKEAIKNTNIKEENTIKEETNKQEISNIFDSFTDDSDTTSTYHVYIVREGDTLEQIQDKYKTTLELLNQYNDLTEIKLGDKIIIPEKI